MRAKPPKLKSQARHKTDTSFATQSDEDRTGPAPGQNDAFDPTLTIFTVLVAVAVSGKATFGETP
jgi:hypothetical protein